MENEVKALFGKLMFEIAGWTATVNQQTAQIAELQAEIAELKKTKAGKRVAKSRASK